MFQKQQYVSKSETLAENHGALQGTVIEDMASVKRHRSRPAKRWTQDINDIRDMNDHEAWGELVTDGNVFSGESCKEHVARIK